MKTYILIKYFKWPYETIMHQNILIILKEKKINKYQLLPPSCNKDCPHRNDNINYVNDVIRHHCCESLFYSILSMIPPLH